MTLKIALAGAGYIAEIHARAIQQHSDAALVAVVEKFPEQASKFGKTHKIKHKFVTVEEMIAAGGVDALVIGTPNFLHAPQAITALESGIHVMVEKPMAINTAEALAMQAIAEESGAHLMVAHCWRFDQEVLWLKAQTNKLGQLIRTKGIGVHSNWGPGGWFTQKALAGGGALADMGIHAIDTARFLLDDPQPVSVYAKIGTHYGNYDVDDTGVIFINWDNGVTSFIESGWWQPHMDGPGSPIWMGRRPLPNSMGRRASGRFSPPGWKFRTPRMNALIRLTAAFVFHGKSIALRTCMIARWPTL